MSEIYREDARGLFGKLPQNAHKGMMGRVLCICGSYDGRGVSMCGAAYFASMAAYRCGAGIVEIFTARKNYESLASSVPEAVFSLYESSEDTVSVCNRLRERIALADAVVIGCGLGKSEMSRAIVAETLASADSPLVADADALNICSEDKNLLMLMSRSQRARTVLTPHPGEMARLTGLSVGEIQRDRVRAARELAASLGVVCLLKGNGTVITDGSELYINHSGNAGMATGGMGDVLSGIIGALLARQDVLAVGTNSDIGDVTNENEFCFASDADSANGILYRAAVGAYIHGLAADSAAETSGEYSLMASDVLHAIPSVLRKL